MKISTLGVVGAGQMGNGIAQVAAACGIKVIMTDITQEAADLGRNVIETNLSRLVEKGKIDPKEMAQILGRIEPCSVLDNLSEVEYVVEAATENLDIKAEIFRQLDHICSSQTILASNTSSIPIGKIGATTNRSEKVIGMHFMNPVPIMKLVEVIPSLTTSTKTHEITWALCEKLGKVPVKAADYPGFLANRILMPMINEAIFCLHEGVGSASDIDEVMKLGMNHPMGPLALADLIGLDTCLAIMKTLYEGFGDPKYRVCPLLKQYVEAGRLGRKSGRGFYSY